MDVPDSTSCLLDVDAKRICVIKPSALGDVVQSLPLLSALRARFPHAHISWVVNQTYVPLLEGHPDLNEIIPFMRRGNWNDWRKLVGRLRQSAFDLAFDLQGLFRTALMMIATRAPLRVGLETAREGSLWGCHVLVPGTESSVRPHERCRRIAEAMGVGDVAMRTRVAISPEHFDWADRMLAPLGGPILAIHAGARWSTKRWPPERFAAVASKAVRRFGMSPLLVGAPSDEGLARQLENTIRAMAPATRLLNLTGQTGLKQLAAVLRRSNVLLTNDSGPMQLAAGLGTPVVGVFTCTSPTLSGPPGPEHVLVSSEVSCAASYRKRCPHRGCRHLACMEELEVERVWSGLCRLMQSKPQQTKAA